jgi:hypothetical protein
MPQSRRTKCRTVAAKLPSDLIVQLDRIAEYRCITRSFLIRELAEAAVDGRVIFLPPPRPRDMSVAELGASSVGAAARIAAQRDAAVACRRVAATGEVDVSAQDLDAVARRAARLIAEER